MYNIYVEDFMIREVKFIWQNMTYHELKAVLRENRRLRVFPLVEKPGEGSVVHCHSKQIQYIINSLDII